MVQNFQTLLMTESKIIILRHLLAFNYSDHRCSYKTAGHNARRLPSQRRH